MKKIDDLREPLERHAAYDELATIEVRVLKNRVHYDEGYREAEAGETVFMSEADFDVLEPLAQVQLEEEAKARDERDAKRVKKEAP